MKSIKRKENRTWFLKGMRHGVPIGLGYFAVAFTLGIQAKSIGMTPLQSALMSFTMHASAGEFAAMTVIAAGSGYVEMAITQLVINLRYLLMSCALSQKVSEKLWFPHRFFVSYYITDEIFGILGTLAEQAVHSHEGIGDNGKTVDKTAATVIFCRLVGYIAHIIACFKTSHRSA